MSDTEEPVVSDVSEEPAVTEEVDAEEPVVSEAVEEAPEEPAVTEVVEDVEPAEVATEEPAEVATEEPAEVATEEPAEPTVTPVEKVATDIRNILNDTPNESKDESSLILSEDYFEKILNTTIIYLNENNDVKKCIKYINKLENELNLSSEILSNFENANKINNIILNIKKIFHIKDLKLFMSTLN